MRKWFPGLSLWTCVSPPSKAETRWRDAESVPTAELTSPFLSHHQKIFILMQNCQDYQVSHHSLSISPLIQGIPTELEGGSGEKRRGGGSLREWERVHFQPPQWALYWAPSAAVWGRVNCGLQGELAGPFFSPLLLLPHPCLPPPSSPSSVS